MSREWNGWSGRDDVKCIAEGGVRVKLINGKCGELEYRTTSGDMIRWWVEEGRVYRDIRDEEQEVDEIWFENGIPIEYPPAVAVSRAASKRLTEMALKNKIFRELIDDDYFQSGIERGRRPSSSLIGRRKSYSRTPPPPPLVGQNRPVTGRVSPTHWNRPWREKITSPGGNYHKSDRSSYYNRHSSQFRRPSSRSRSRSHSRSRTPGSGLLMSPRRSTSPHLSNRTDSVWSTPFCPHCGQAANSSSTPFCPQTGIRHSINS
eukprot:TRINITY_DN31876_c0_g1_i1.p1 TRINITY_DN31876_c0_g1~~TRINITY_DN31876_c0_g1_i1.p1  ORF type:complete len:261 (+),score=31.72 TRINITY_DN31876_c0_g1_i1:132-914(+)